MTQKKPEKQQPAQEAPKRPGRSLDDFKRNFDKSYIVPTRIREGLEKLADSWVTEVEFAKLAGVSLPEMAAYRDAFEEHIVVLPGEHKGKRIWAGSKAMAEKMRGMLR